MASCGKSWGATRNTPGWFTVGSSPAYGEVLMRCPKCNSDESNKLSLVYLNGISDIRTRSRGRGFDFGETAGAFSFGSRGRGTFQTRLSKLAGPPPKLPYRHVILWWALGLAIMYWLSGELVGIHQLSAVRSVTLFPQYAHIYSGLA